MTTELSPVLTRRDLLRSSLVLSASSLVAGSPLARAHALLSAYPSGAATAEALAAVAPREQLLMDFGWKFQFGHATDPTKDLGFGFGQGDFSKTGEFDFAKEKFDDSKWRALHLPHDWAPELPFVRDESLNSHGFKPLGRRYPETSVGWYRREFDIPAGDQGRRISVEFDGAFRSALVFVNGCFIGRNDNGYAPFRFDLSDFLNYGGKNFIVVRMDASFGDGWFYEGAGIYRHVWLTKTDALHLGKWDSVVRSEVIAAGKGTAAALTLTTTVKNEGPTPESPLVTWQILDADGKQVATAQAPPQSVAADGSVVFTTTAKIPNPTLWSVDQPTLYTAIVSIETAGKPRDGERISFGIRTTRWDADHGFFLNDQPLKIKGTCNHQDHAGVGAALPDRLQFYRIAVLKDMGSNGIRTSHNMPTPEWVEACDRLGMVMMCETRQMSSSPEGLAQLEVMVKRYRNSPSIILWSIGNEEWQLQETMAEQGAAIAHTMVAHVKELDPTRPVSAAVNGNNKKGISLAFDVIGFNYNLNYPDDYHKANPTKPIYGSETASAISTRGVYQTDTLRNTESAYDSNHPAWAELAEEWWKFYATREWLAGGFAWTGFDYRGEPTPYGWPSISSQFGIVDTCGYPKDSFYYYKAWWGSEPVLHLFPHWNWEQRNGEPISVWVHSNLDEVELLLNGKSLGSQKVPHLGHLEWKVPYEPGTLEARGKGTSPKDGKPVTLTAKRETVGAPATIRLTQLPSMHPTDEILPATPAPMLADGEDVAIIRVEVLDKDGRPHPTYSNLLQFKVTGEGALIGVGNGDPNCVESDREPKRSLFNGLAQVLLQSTKTPGTITLEAWAEDWPGPKLPKTTLVIPTAKTELRPQI